ncbi:hypothetical protein KKG52_01500 [Patescibacteria group bacterium]|nr:hypothetical protein [Patescibacteria group bacterium]
MRNLETFMNLSEVPSVVNPPKIPPVGPKDVFIKQRSTNAPLFPENRHMTNFELKSMISAGHMGIDKDLSVNEGPLIAEEPSIFTESTSSVVKVLKMPIKHAREIYHQPSDTLKKAA